MSTLKVHSLESFGTHEGPGIRFVIFLQGCDFNCLYCHNVDTQEINSKSAKNTPVDELIEKIVENKPYFKDKGGLTVSGGEPLLQATGLIELFKKVKAAGIKTALDTNGSLLTTDVKKLLDQTDLVLLDVKHIDDTFHKKITGQSNKTTLEFAAYLKQKNIPFWIRYVLVPGLSDQEEYIEKLGRHFRDYENLERLEILPYHTLGAYKYEELNIPYKLKGVLPPEKETIKKTQKILQKFIKEVAIR